MRGRQNKLGKKVEVDEKIVNSMNTISEQLLDMASQTNDLETNKTDKTYTDNQLTLKRDKSTKIDTVDLTETVLQQMAGTTPINSVPQDGSVTPLKATFFTPSQNLFNKNTITAGYLLDVGTGGLTVNSSYSVSDYIPVKPNTTYTAKYDGKKCFYNSSKQFISGSEPIGSTFTTPANTVYMRITIWGTSVSVFMLVEGSTLPTTYIPYLFTFNKNNNVYPLQIIDETDIPVNSIGTANVKQNSITAEQTMFLVKSQNLFNRATATANYYVAYTTGNLTASSGWNASDYIPVEPNTTYIRSFDTHIAFYDKNKAYISGYDNGAGHQSFTTPSNAMYVRISIYATDITTSTFMVVKGSTLPTSYVPFSYSFDSKLNVILDDVRFNTIFKWKSKNWLAVGDSITAYQKYQPLVQNACLIGNIVTCATPGIALRNMIANVTSDMVNNADLVSVYCVANDFGGNRPIGTMADTKDTQSFYGDVKNAISTILTYKPTARLAFILTTRIGTFIGGGNYPTYPQPNGVGAYQSDYNKAVKEVCEYYGIPVLDLYANSGFNEFNLSSYTNDNLHPNDTGYAKISSMITSFFNSL